MKIDFIETSFFIPIIIEKICLIWVAIYFLLEKTFAIRYCEFKIINQQNIKGDSE